MGMWARADDVLVGLDEAVGGVARRSGSSTGAHGREGDREPVGEPGRVLVGPQSLHQRLPRHSMLLAEDQDLQQLAGFAGLPLLHRYRLARPHHPEAAERMRTGSRGGAATARSSPAATSAPTRTPSACRRRSACSTAGERAPEPSRPPGTPRRFPVPGGRSGEAGLRERVARLAEPVADGRPDRRRLPQPRQLPGWPARQRSPTPRPSRLDRDGCRRGGCGGRAADACSRSPAASATSRRRAEARPRPCPARSRAPGRPARRPGSARRRLAPGKARQAGTRPWRSPGLLSEAGRPRRRLWPGPGRLARGTPGRDRRADRRPCGRPSADRSPWRPPVRRWPRR